MCAVTGDGICTMRALKLAKDVGVNAKLRASAVRQVLLHSEYCENAEQVQASLRLAHEWDIDDKSEAVVVARQVLQRRQQDHIRIALRDCVQSTLVDHLLAALRASSSGEPLQLRLLAAIEDARAAELDTGSSCDELREAEAAAQNLARAALRIIMSGDTKDSARSDASIMSCAIDFAIAVGVPSDATELREAFRRLGNRVASRYAAAAAAECLYLNDTLAQALVTANEKIDRAKQACGLQALADQLRRAGVEGDDDHLRSIDEAAAELQRAARQAQQVLARLALTSSLNLVHNVAHSKANSGASLSGETKNRRPEVGTPDIARDGLVSWFRSRDITAETWPSVVGDFKGRVANGGGPVEVKVEAGHGAEAAVQMLAGGTGSAYNFGQILPETYTVCSVSRYTGGTRGRILQGTRSNWLHGHWGGQAGVAHYDGWMGQHNSRVTPIDDWVIMCGTSRRVYLEKQGVVAQRGNHVAGNQGVVINMGRYGGEVSDWAVAEVITWDRELSDDEMEAVCAHMRHLLDYGDDVALASNLMLERAAGHAIAAGLDPISCPELADAQTMQQQLVSNTLDEVDLMCARALSDYDDAVDAATVNEAAGAHALPTEMVPPEGLVSWFRSRDITAETWPSVVGDFKGRVANGGGPVEVKVEAGHGAEAAVQMLAGGTGSAYNFGQILPETYTVCSVSRYTGGTRGRILQGTRSNWLHGHWGGQAGVAHYDGWMGQHNSRVTPVDDWVIMCGTSRRVYLEKQGVVAQRGNHVAGNQGVVINMGRYGGEVSDWAVAEVITWDRELSDDEMETVCAYMRAVLDDGDVPIPMKPLNAALRDLQAVLERAALAGLNAENSPRVAGLRDTQVELIEILIEEAMSAATGRLAKLDEAIDLADEAGVAEHQSELLRQAQRCKILARYNPAPLKVQPQPSVESKDVKSMSMPHTIQLENLRHRLFERGITTCCVCRGNGTLDHLKRRVGPLQRQKSAQETPSKLEGTASKVPRLLRQRSAGQVLEYRHERGLDSCASNVGGKAAGRGDGDSGSEARDKDEWSTGITCWLCKGSGSISQWVRSFDAPGPGALDTEPDAATCRICWVNQAEYGVSTECEHFYCATCIERTLQMILDHGKFPACCPACADEVTSKEGDEAPRGRITGAATDLPAAEKCDLRADAVPLYAASAGAGSGAGIFPVPV